MPTGRRNISPPITATSPIFRLHNIRRSCGGYFCKYNFLVPFDGKLKLHYNKVSFITIAAICFAIIKVLRKSTNRRVCIILYIAHYEKANPNIKYFKLRNKGKFSGLVHSHEGLTWHEPKSGVVTIKTIDQLAEYLLLCKKQVVDDFKANHNADKIIEELSEEYFRKELDKGNIELVAIKLCVRLETVLKSKYHYEGDFSEMLEKYCSQYGVYEEDDGWGYIEKRTHEFVTYLQKLRKYRNCIVHSEKKVDKMTKEELEFCIKYICGLK